MDGIINVYKVEGMTSFDVVRKVKKITKIKKVGHTGTLDPLATGVLPICLGRATKIVDYIMSGSKLYRAQLKLGVVTDTYDREGEILEENAIDVDQESLVNCINSFVGNIKQIPPMYSALKVNGKRLYELARQGIEVEREAREITIYNIDIVEIQLPYVTIDVKCSKGTYIRSLCYDIGMKLGCGAAMWSLERVSTGQFSKEESISIEDLNEENYLENIISLEKLFNHYPKLNLNDKFGKLASNGVTIKDRGLLDTIENEGLYGIYVDDNKFIGIGERFKHGFKMVKLFL